ncbi:MAG: hypothetical protein COA77_01375 [Thaumarchaeota archaeon]|nr:MAG: hypothetical protein COA77_01375 [Nitrososphaerota archaeon]
MSLSFADETTPKYSAMKNFPYDSEKGVEHYLERYYSESIYKTWFHNNFSGTIEEGVGLTQSYSQIQENIDDCPDKARYVAQQYAQNNYDSYNLDTNYYYVYENSISNCINTSGIRDLNDAGVILASMNLHKEAIVLYDKAIDLHQQYTIATANKATSLFELDKFEESEKMFDRAIVLDPQNNEIKDLSNTIKNKIEQKPKKETVLQTTSTGIICGAGTELVDDICQVIKNNNRQSVTLGSILKSWFGMFS